jgi:GDP-mannose 6-dehydrogenase
MSRTLVWRSHKVSLSISIFGLGYVGSVTATCLAHMGHRVVGVDVSSAKVAMMAAGHSPIVEARMSELIAEAHEACRLHATTDACAAIEGSEISFICVGTPSLRSGKLDLRHVERVASEIGTALRAKKSNHIIALRSTVLPGTTESVVIPAIEKASGRQEGADFRVCYNPEFMREASAVADFLEPPYTILGARDPKHLGLIRELYKSTPGRVFETGIPVAEMVKYVSNAFHALKVGFANEIGILCKSMELDTESVVKIFNSDTRLNISSAYLSPGFAFGGSCLPKDLRALVHCAKELDLELPLLESILPSNNLHVDRAVDRVLHTQRKKISVLGLSFKSGTDDLRESPQVQFIKRLLGEGCQIRVWDRDVSLGKLAGSNRQYIEEVIPHIGSLLSADLEEVVRSGEVVVIGTRVEKGQLARYLRPHQIIIDLVNLEVANRPNTTASYQGICW